jgi:hypothetical protein
VATVIDNNNIIVTMKCIFNKKIIIKVTISKSIKILISAEIVIFTTPTNSSILPINFGLELFK